MGRGHGGTHPGLRPRAPSPRSERNHGHGFVHKTWVATEITNFVVKGVSLKFWRLANNWAKRSMLL